MKTEKQIKIDGKAIISFIQAFLEEHGSPPTFREIMLSTGIKSTSHMQYKINALQDIGVLTYQPRKPRSIKLL